MGLRTTFLALTLIVSPGWAGHNNTLGQSNGRGMDGSGGGQQQQQQQQQLQGGMGGGASAEYESKREDIQKAFEQPAQEARKAMTENTTKFAAETKAMLQETTKFIQSGMAKDEKLDEKTATALSATPAVSNEAIKSSANEIIASIQQISQSQAALVMKQAETAVAAMTTGAAATPAPAAATLGERIQMASSGRTGTGLASINRAPTSTPASVPGDTSAPQTSSGSLTLGGNPIPTTDPKAFHRGLLHNPPGGVSID